MRCGNAAKLLIAVTEGRVKRRQGKCGFPLYYFISESSGRYEGKGTEETMREGKGTTKDALTEVRESMQAFRWTDLFEVLPKTTIHTTITSHVSANNTMTQASALTQQLHVQCIRGVCSCTKRTNGTPP